MPKNYYVYIMTNKRNTVLYTGMSGNAPQRFWEHREKVSPNSFTARYHVNKVVYTESFSTPQEAAEAERVIKGWTRKKKLDLIHSINPEWKDLSAS